MSLISFFKPPATVAKPAPAPATTVPAAKPAAATQPAPSFKADSFQPAKASPSRMPVLFSQPPPQVQNIVTPVQAGQAGQAGNPYKLHTEFGYVLNRTWSRYGQAGADRVQTAVDQLKNGQQPAVSTAVPQVGDVMVWGPNAGDSGPTGQADGAGHMGVVESVTDNHDGTVTIRVSERNWSNQDGTTADGVPYRDITVPVNNGQLSLPTGVGFISGNPDASSSAAASSGTGTGGVQNPPIGPSSTPIDRPGFMVHDPNLPAHSSTDPYTDCIGYIHDIPAYRGTIESLANGGFLAAADIPHTGTVPHAGDLMVWGRNAGDSTVGTTGGLGHVGYIEEATPNYDPPGDPNGRVVSYTITISEANANGDGSDDRTLRTFTVGADASGNAQLPADVGFYSNGSGGTAATSTAPAVPSGAPIAHGSTYSVQSGDTLTSIAARAGTTVQAIVDLNHLTNADALSIGQSLRIP